MNGLLRPLHTKSYFFRPRIFHRTISLTYKERAIVSSFLFTKPSKEEPLKLVLFKRSDSTKNYPGKWAVCSGSIESTDVNPLAAAKREIQEETQLSGDNLLLLSQGESYTLTDEELKTKWTIHPFAFQLHVHSSGLPPTIKLDSEHEKYKLIDLEELKSYDHVPNLEKGLQSLAFTGFAKS